MRRVEILSILEGDTAPSSASLGIAWQVFLSRSHTLPTRELPELSTVTLIRYRIRSSFRGTVCPVTGCSGECNPEEGKVSYPYL